jgi:trk system potassium uptake protein
MNLRPIFYVNGLLLLMMSMAMLIPLGVDFSIGNPDWKAFLTALVVTFFIGLSLVLVNYDKKFRMSVRDVFILTTLSFITASAFGALPFCFADVSLSYSKAFFEAMSGVTTTGSTVLAGLDAMPPGILLWRAILHWLGGIGFVVIALAILPILQISGMQIYKSQAFGSDVDKVLPSAGQMAFHLCGVYVILTAICMLCYEAAGMNWLESICHAMATLSTGGFSTSDGSIGHFHSPAIEWIAVFFMLAGGFPFVHYLKLMRGHFTFFQDSQVRAALAIIAALAASMAAYLVVTGQQPFMEAVRNSAFMITTLISTTGFITVDYTTWGSFAICLAFLTTSLGLCSGSTAGGLKIFRLQILTRTFQQQLRQLIYPHGVFTVNYNGKRVEEGVKAATVGFVFIYMALWFIFTVLLSLTGLDFETCVSAALTAIANVGPGIGKVIGPAGNFSTLSPGALFVLDIAMLLGRLEFMTVLVLLTPYFWRN